MKNKAQKQKDLDALAEKFKNSNAAMLVSLLSREAIPLSHGRSESSMNP